MTGPTPKIPILADRPFRRIPKCFKFAGSVNIIIS